MILKVFGEKSHVVYVYKLHMHYHIQYSYKSCIHFPPWLSENHFPHPNIPSPGNTPIWPDKWKMNRLPFVVDTRGSAGSFLSEKRAGFKETESRLLALHCKNAGLFPVPSRYVKTKFSLDGNTSRLGPGKPITFFTVYSQAKNMFWILY